MNINQILSKRYIGNQNYAQNIIYEWEDVIADSMKIIIKGVNSIERLANRLHLHSTLFTSYENSLYFITNAKNRDESYNKKNIVPWIIDFFVKENELKDFYKLHSKNKIILLSSPFDYEYLKHNSCPIPVGLVAYSIPDKYVKTLDNHNKVYDFVLTGRQDPLLYSFFKEYIKRHPSVTYVKRGKWKGEDGDNRYYINGEQLLGDLRTRDEYISLLSKAKVSLYGTQGYIKNNFTTGFYHVTPRFLEEVVCGCHVLAHYPQASPDALYYQLDKFSPSIETYELFEEYADKARTSNIDINFYKDYILKHCTSARVRQLTELIDGL